MFWLKRKLVEKELGIAFLEHGLVRAPRAGDVFNVGDPLPDAAGQKGPTRVPLVTSTVGTKVAP